MLLKIHLDSCRVERDRSGEERKACLESLVFVFLLRKLQSLCFQIQFHCKNPCGDWLTGGLAARLCSYYFQSYLIWKWQLAVLRILGSLSSSKHFSSAIHSTGNCVKFLGDEEEGAKIQNCIQRDICRPVRPSVWSRIWVATHIFLFSTMLLSCVPAGECRTRFTFQLFKTTKKRKLKTEKGISRQAREGYTYKHLGIKRNIMKVLEYLTGQKKEKESIFSFSRSFFSPEVIGAYTWIYGLIVQSIK